MATVQNEEVVLQILETASQNERIAVCMVRCPVSETTRIRLRAESYSSHVGWYTQGHVDLSPEQIQSLRLVLGPIATEAMPATRKVARGGKVWASATPNAQADPPATIKLSPNRAG